MLNIKKYLSELMGFHTSKDNPPSPNTPVELENTHSTATIWEQMKPLRNFAANLPQNIGLAIATTPTERLALERIRFTIKNPTLKPPSYSSTIQDLKLSGLFAGTHARTSYCLIGNFSTLIGISFLGNDTYGLIATAGLKNIIFPVFIWSNAKQSKYTKAETTESILKGMIDPGGHAAFFFRNVLANICLIPGFKVCNYTYQALGEKDETIPKALGLITSLACSTMMNSLTKPVFTDPAKFPLLKRLETVPLAPGKFAIAGREICSLLLMFGSIHPQKASQAPSCDKPESSQDRKLRP